MSEKRFIQLINLYIDGEISSRELEELENEVSRDARRREVYQSYCRLQKASQVVYHKFGSALTETVDLKKYHILARDSARAIRRGLLYSAGALAAACLTVVAAVSFFQEAHRGPVFGDHGWDDSHGVVEVFEPRSRSNRSDRGSILTAGASESFFFAGRPAAVAPQKKTEFDPTRSPTRDPFQASPRLTGWEGGFSPNSSPKVIRGDSSFDVVPELASFQFQR